MSKSKKVRKIEAKIRKLEQKLLVRILQERPVAELNLLLRNTRKVIVERKERAARLRAWRNLTPEQYVLECTRSSGGRAPA